MSNEMLIRRYQSALTENTRKGAERIIQLEQENKQLNSILTELEEWLEMMEEKETIGTYSMVQDKIQELKEKYK